MASKRRIRYGLRPVVARDVSMPRSFRVLFALLLSVQAAAGSMETTRPEDVGISSERLQRVSEHLRTLVDEKKAAGIQFVVARRGSVVLQEAFGVRSVDSGEPVNDDTLFRIFSMTKPVVGVAMMMLYEEGKFSMSDPVSKYIPEFRSLQVYAGENENGSILLEDAKRPPLMQDLFRHTAGLTYGFFGDTAVDKLYVEAELLDPQSNLQAMIEGLAELPLLYQPGERYEYSMGVDVQAYLIEKYSGMDVESFLRERIFEPLGMDETMAWVPPKYAPRLSDIHTHNEDGQLVVLTQALGNDIAAPAYEEPSLFNGGGQLISSADDYYRFAQMLLNGGELDGVRLLSPSTVAMMTSNRLPVTVADREIAPGSGHGLNLRVVSDRTQIGFPASDGEFAHGGMASTYFWADPTEELVVVVLTQYLPYSGQVYSDILHRLVHAAIID